VLVLAASVYQVPIIETAKRLGYRVVTTDNVPDNPGHRLADASHDVDTMDTRRVLDLARREQICGILAPCTDVAVTTAAHVAEQLGLPGPPRASTHILTEKRRFRAFQSGAGFAAPQHVCLGEGERPHPGLFDGRHWLIKPNRGSGCKGVFVIRTAADYARHVAECQSYCGDDTVVMEEYLTGTQHSCEGMVLAGRVVQSLVTDRDTAPWPYTATTGHRVPSRLTAAMQDLALRTIETLMQQLDIQAGPFDCDFIADGERIVLLELTPRLGGNSLYRLYGFALGVDLAVNAIAYACGEPLDLPEQGTPRACALTILGVRDRAGRLSWNAAEASALRAEPWVHSLDFDVAQGTNVEPFKHGRCRVGEALISAEDRTGVDQRLQELQQRLALQAI
jgi:biotin carboxylase